MGPGRPVSLSGKANESSFRPKGEGRPDSHAWNNVNDPSKRSQRSHVASTIEPQPYLPCPEDTCELRFSSAADVSNHISIGKHWRELEDTGIKDTAVLAYQKAMQSDSLMSVAYSTNVEKASAAELSPSGQIQMGWGLKTSPTRVTFTDAQKSFLLRKFQEGEETKQKSTPDAVFREMVGKFPEDEVLTRPQITKYFSRLASTKRLSKADQESVVDMGEEDQDDLIAVVDECSLIADLVSVSVQDLETDDDPLGDMTTE